MSTDHQRQLEANFAAALEPLPDIATPAPAPPAKYQGRTRDLNSFFWAVDRIRRDPNPELLTYPLPKMSAFVSGGLLNAVVQAQPRPREDDL